MRETQRYRKASPCSCGAFLNIFVSNQTLSFFSDNDRRTDSWIRRKKKKKRKEVARSSCRGFVAQWLERAASIRKTGGAALCFLSDSAVSFSIFVREKGENLTRNDSNKNEICLCLAVISFFFFFFFFFFLSPRNAITAKCVRCSYQDHSAPDMMLTGGIEAIWTTFLCESCAFCFKMMIKCPQNEKQQWVGLPVGDKEREGEGEKAAK